MLEIQKLKKNYSASRRLASQGDKAALARLLVIGRRLNELGHRIPKRRRSKK